jgi:hypothetical protein
MDVDIMVDCMACGSQKWRVTEIDDERVRFECNECRENETVGLQPTYDAYDCHICQGTDWSITDRTEDHCVFECSDCQLNAEYWLRDR